MGGRLAQMEGACRGWNFVIDGIGLVDHMEGMMISSNGISSIV